MMRTVSLLAALTLTAEGAATLKGLLIRNEIGGAPVAGAAVGADGANPTTSTQLGAFTLDFPNRKPGERVKLTVAKDGMVVVNWVQLDALLPADPGGANILTLIVAREAEREEMARRFFRLRSYAEIEANFKRLLEEGKQDRARLLKERDVATAAASRAAAYQEALDIFQKFAERDPAQYQPLVAAVEADLAEIEK